MKIFKFGGTSVGSPENISRIKSIIDSVDSPIAVVVSAFGGVTDQLIEISNLAQKHDSDYLKLVEQLKERHVQAVKVLLHVKDQNLTLKEIEKQIKKLSDLLHGIYLLKELSPRSLDLIMSFGERLSAYIISQYLNADFLDARLLLKTDSNFNNAKLDFDLSNKNIQKYFKNHKKLQIITGFIASNVNDETTTLGRGGSDYTASIFAAALDAEEIQIWTDVNGIMSADPRKAKNAFTLEKLSYREAMEMSHFGAKVICPPTMQPALKKNIPIFIKNTMQADFPGSLIGKDSNAIGSAIKGISSISDVDLLSLQGSGLVGVVGVSQRLFAVLAKANISIILISQASSEHSICFAIRPEDSQKAKYVIEEEFKHEIFEKQVEPIIVEKDLSIIAVVGENMSKVPGTSGKVFSALGKNGINVKAIAQGSSELNISIVIDKKHEEKAINVIHDALFFSKMKTLNLFIVGPGLVGSTLLKQIKEQSQQLANTQNLKLQIIGLANSKKFIIEKEGINLSDWKEKLKKANDGELTEFLKKIKELNLENSVFVDCTSSEIVAKSYSELLKSSISVVTPNKKAQSSNIKNYLNLARTAAKSNAKFLYETNVGAGLPVIKTLHDLQLSGDRIQKIEAILSGTLSYIFNTFDNKIPFSELIKKAQEKGYTEPDPRDDLNGMDVARKILILARETGHLLELEDVQVENLVPQDCRDTKSIKEFYEKLKKYDQNFLEKYENAHKENKRLRYIASLEDGQAKVELKALDQNHPFYNLSGTDNVIAYTSKYYKDCPLVVKGPGAGADVTAAGILADIIRIANINFNSQMTKYDFLDKLKSHNLTISLIGMSNIGKSYWSERLEEFGFKRICCDDIIEKKLEPELKEKGYKGIHDMAKWLGQPYDTQFQENEKKYLDFEEETMHEILSKSINENTIIDTTGSVIHTSEKISSELKRKSLVICIEASPDMKEEILEAYLQHPKPVVWAGNYKKNIKLDNSESLKESYKKLLEKRSKLYSELADIILPAKDVQKINQSQFLQLIQEKL